MKVDFLTASFARLQKQNLKISKRPKGFFKNVGKDLARIKERVDIDKANDDSENDEKNDQMTSSLMIREEST